MQNCWDCSFCGAKEGESCKSTACHKASLLRSERDALLLQISELKASAGLVVCSVKHNPGCICARNALEAWQRVEMLEIERKEQVRLFGEAMEILRNLQPSHPRWNSPSIGVQDPCGINAFIEKYDTEKRKCECWEKPLPAGQVCGQCGGCGC